MSRIENEILFEYIRSSGPGGQNVNKVATAVQLRFDVARSPSLREEVKSRLVKLAGRRVTAEGILVIEAKRFRTQEQNRFDALERFYGLLKKASQKPKARRPGKPTRASQEKRLQSKRRAGQVKRGRQGKDW